jgi:hypothetical protein
MVPSDYNGTKKFLWPTGTIAITSQPNALLTFCGDVGVLKPTVLPVI